MKSFIMEGRPSAPLLSQTRQQTCYTWIGYSPGDRQEHFAGQTFECPQDALVDFVEIYLATVLRNGILQMSLHEFDPETETWQPAQRTCEFSLHEWQRENWVRFSFEPLQLQAGQTYGFKLAARDMLVAVADAATDNTGYLHKGREWNSETENQGGRYFQYFSLVFRIGQDSRA
jgi:hypothetical protein